MTLHSLGLLTAGHPTPPRTIGRLVAAFVAERPRAVLIFLADAPPIRAVDDIDRALGWALRIREGMHARGFRFGEVQP